MAQIKSTSSSAAAPASAKPAATARVALIGLDDAELSLLTDSFKQFNVRATALSREDKKRLSKEKFEGCVLRLDEAAEPILQAARNSPSNRHMLIYGIATDTQSAMRYSSFCINAIFRAPLERSAALKVVRSTYLLALHEYRRYVRIPLAVEVLLNADGRRVTALSEEISSGGMSLRVPELMHGKIKAQAKFVLPEALDININATICWRRETDSMLGIRFDSEDNARQLVRRWIDEFLQF
jgi:PilZ domain